MSNVVETIVNTDFFEIPGKSNNAQAQEVKDYTEFLKIECQKNRKYKIILEGIEECLEDQNNIDEDLRNKIKNVILETNVSQTRLYANENQASSNTVLDIAVENTEISYVESNKLLGCLKSKLESKSVKFKNDCISIFGKDIKEISMEKGKFPLELSQEDAELLKFRKKLVLEQECFVNNQIELLEILEELKNIRLNTVPEVTEQKIKDCNLRSKINHLKSQLAKIKCKLDIFMESSNSLKAHSEVIKDMKEQQSQLNLEIEQLKELKKKYADVSCKEYDDILESYLQYRATYEKKKMMYELYG